MTTLTPPNTNVRDATRLLMMSMTPGINATQNKEYQGLLQRYSGEPDFQKCVQQAAEGMDLRILESDIRNLYLRAETKDSVFAYRLSDMRTYQPSQRVAYFLCAISLSATFFPDVQSLTSSGALAPLTRKELHDALNDHIVALVKASTAANTTINDTSIKTGLDVLQALPASRINAAASYRGGLTSRSGVLELVMGDMKDQGFLRIDEQSSVEASQVFPTHKFRQHLGAEGGAIEILMTLLKKDDNE